ncbi:MAG: GspH/FimT family pseudopilin [Thiobacillaceae bacterium]
MTQRRQSGVTLIELLVTISIAAILMAIAVPGFQDFFRRNRLDSATSDLMATLNYARSEAIRRGVPVSVCRSSNGESCSGGWQEGWIVFTNPDNDDTVDAGEEILRVHQALPNGITLNANTNFTTRITYRSDGRITNTVGGTFFFCPASGTTDARQIVVNGAGRARIEHAATCS